MRVIGKEHVVYARCSRANLDTMQKTILLSLLEESRETLITQNEEIQGQRTSLAQATLWSNNLGKILVDFHPVSDRGNATHHQINPVRIKAQ
jgi:hypothetical protein